MPPDRADWKELSAPKLGLRKNCGRSLKCSGRETGKEVARNTPTFPAMVKYIFYLPFCATTRSLQCLNKAKKRHGMLYISHRQTQNGHRAVLQPKCLLLDASMTGSLSNSTCSLALRISHLSSPTCCIKCSTSCSFCGNTSSSMLIDLIQRPVVCLGVKSRNSRRLESICSGVAPSNR